MSRPSTTTRVQPETRALDRRTRWWVEPVIASIVTAVALVAATIALSLAAYVGTLFSTGFVIGLGDAASTLGT